MKAALTRGVGKGFEVVDVIIDQPRGREVLIDVKASGLCHSDLHIETHGFGFEFPVVLGHEVAGLVTAVGPDVTGIKVGDRVAACLLQFCGACEECLSGRTFQCTNQAVVNRGPDEEPRLRLESGEPLTQFFGISGFAEQALIHENQLAVINDEIPWEQAALIGCSVVTGAGCSINTAQVRVGDSVAVIGTGGIGLNAISGARIAGARTIVAIDIDDAKLKVARDFGATHVINSRTDNPVEKIKEICGGVNHAIEAIGLPATQKQAYELTRPGGMAYMIGIAPPESELTIDSSLGLLAAHNGVQGCWMGSTNLKRDIPMYADLYTQGRINLDDMVSQTIGLEDIGSAYEQLTKGGNIRSVITF